MILIKNIIWLLLAIVGVIWLMWWISYGNVQKAEARHVRVCFCHNVENNPHTICTDNHALIRGHGRHVARGFDSLGVCENGNGEEPTPTPTVEPTPTIDECERKGGCEPTPTEEPKRCQGESYIGDFCGWSPPVSPQESYTPPVCTVALPERVGPNVLKRVDNDTILVGWQADDTNTTHWALNYGYSKQDLPYGIPYLPKEARSVEVNGLGPGHVWFELWRFNTPECAVWGNRIDP